MARTNPYSVTNDGQSVINGGVVVTIEDVNSELNGGTQIDHIETGCSCNGDNRKYSSTTQLHRGDKWGLKMCRECGGVWGWHDARADYL